MRNAFTMLNVEGLLKQFLAAETVGEVQCDNCSVENGKSVFVKQLSLGKVYFYQLIIYLHILMVLDVVKIISYPNVFVFTFNVATGPMQAN